MPYAQTELLAQIEDDTAGVVTVFTAAIRTEVVRIHWYLPTSGTQVKLYHVDDDTTTPTDKHVIALLPGDAAGYIEANAPGTGLTIKEGGRILAQQVTTTNDYYVSLYGATEDQSKAYDQTLMAN